MSVCPAFENVSVLVVGDVMLDRFWSGGTDRISPEAPVPVVRVGDTDNRAGGAGNVAVNLASLGAQVTLAGLCGKDDAATALRAAVESQGVTWAVSPCDGETIVKLRVLSRNQQLLRMDFEGSFESYADDLFMAYIKTLLVDVDVVVFSDYAKGTLTRVADLIEACRAQHTPVVVDPKGTDFERYRGATVITPNLGEFTAVVGAAADNSSIERLGNALRQSLDLDAVLVTRSEQGMSLVAADEPPLHLPTRAREVYDVTGAGDTVISVVAATLGAGESLARATVLANTAAGIVVGKLGTATISGEELLAALLEDQSARLPHIGQTLDEATLSELVAQARAVGERLVMTNGCFDILHPGHVNYLARARDLGDRLIVAVNTDASVARLKGSDRPINDLAARMAVLAGLRSVDWVVPFDEDTPERLISAVLPDVLVKGGDYQPEEIAGGAAVLEAGGEVRVLDFIEGHSTTATIAKISASDD